MLPYVFGGTAGWPEELLGCAPVWPRANEHAQLCRIRVPARPVTFSFSRHGATNWRDARYRE
jgi:hypothetical protein